MRTPNLQPSRELVKEVLGFATLGVTAAVTGGASAIAPAVAKAWVGKQTVSNVADLLCKCLGK